MPKRTEEGEELSDISRELDDASDTSLPPELASLVAECDLQASTEQLIWQQNPEFVQKFCADLLSAISVDPGDTLLVVDHGLPTDVVVSELLRQCEARGIVVNRFIRSRKRLLEFYHSEPVQKKLEELRPKINAASAVQDTAIRQQLTQEFIAAVLETSYFKELKEMVVGIDAIAVVTSGAYEECIAGIDPFVSQAIETFLKEPFGDNLSFVDTLFIFEEEAKYIGTQLASVPPGTNAREDAEEDIQNFMGACDRDWERVEVAQAIIKECLDRQQSFSLVVDFPPDSRFTTNLRWDMVDTKTGDRMKWANSVKKIIVPGSEIFSGPALGAMEGQYAIPHSVTFQLRKLPNIILTFSQGLITNVVVYKELGSKEVDQKSIDHVLSYLQHQGMRAVGEVAFGTNPQVQPGRRPNTALDEKALGFHLALGRTLTAVEEPRTNNGNSAQYHIDLVLSASRLQKLLSGTSSKLTFEVTAYSQPGQQGVETVVFKNGQFQFSGTEYLHTVEPRNMDVSN